MTQEEHELLDLLKFELNFLEDGGYGRSPHTPGRRQLAFEDSLTCPNFGDSSRPHGSTRRNRTRNCGDAVGSFSDRGRRASGKRQ